MLEEETLYIPLSLLNAYAYCARRVYYEFTLAEMEINEHVLAGQQFHERVDQPGTQTRGEALQIHRLYLCAPRLRLVGYCDVLEVRGQKSDSLDLTASGRAGKLLPVEYKKGKLGKWLSDHTQLCAQALALEEVLELPAGSIEHGALFYIGSARRDEVLLDEALRTQTLALLKDARRVAHLVQPPVPVENWRKCRDCSLEPLCLPREVLLIRKQGAIECEEEKRM
jgi:CRISPR-associated exonuclease Cas4